MHECIQIALRSSLAITILFIFTKLMGRKELAQMSIFDYVVGISIGSIGAQMAFDIKEDWYDFLIVLIVYVTIHYLITWATIKSLWARKFFEGAPIIIMEEGKIIEKNLKRVHYDVNTFLEECRLAGYFDIADIHTAIMESSGKISFIIKDNNMDKQEFLVANLIIDGKVMHNNLTEVNKDIQWLQEEVRRQGEEIENILLATYNHEQKLRVYMKMCDINISHVLE